MMKLIRAVNHAFRFILYFTINALFWLCVRFFSVNRHQKYAQIFVLIFVFVFYVAAAAIGYKNSDPPTLTDEISALVNPEVSAIPFLDWYAYLSSTAVFSLHDRETMKKVENILNYGDDEFVPAPVAYMESNNTENDHEGYDRDDSICNYDLAVGGLCACDYECGYEGDNEDNGDYEGDDFNEKIEEFIAAKKMEWRVEMIRERLLCIEAAKL